MYFVFNLKCYQNLFFRIFVSILFLLLCLTLGYTQNVTSVAKQELNYEQFVDYTNTDPIYDEYSDGSVVNISNPLETDYYSDDKGKSEVLDTAESINAQQTTNAVQSQIPQLSFSPNNRGAIDYSTLFQPYVSRPLDFNPFDVFDKDSKKDSLRPLPDINKIFDTSHDSNSNHQNQDSIKTNVPTAGTPIRTEEKSGTTNSGDSFDFYRIQTEYKPAYVPEQTSSVSNTGSYDPNIAYQNLKSPFDSNNFNADKYETINDYNQGQNNGNLYYKQNNYTQTDANPNSGGFIAGSQQPAIKSDFDIRNPIDNRDKIERNLTEFKFFDSPQIIDPVSTSSPLSTGAKHENYERFFKPIEYNHFEGQNNGNLYYKPINYSQIGANPISGGFIAGSQQPVLESGFDIKSLDDSADGNLTEYRIIESPKVISVTSSPTHTGAIHNSYENFFKPIEYTRIGGFSASSGGIISSTQQSVPPVKHNYQNYGQQHSGGLGLSNGGVISTSHQFAFSDINFGQKINKNITDSNDVQIPEPIPDITTNKDSTLNNGQNKTQRIIYRLLEPKPPISSIPIPSLTHWYNRPLTPSWDRPAPGFGIPEQYLIKMDTIPLANKNGVNNVPQTNSENTTPMSTMVDMTESDGAEEEDENNNEDNSKDSAEDIGGDEPGGNGDKTDEEEDQIENQMSSNSETIVGKLKKPSKVVNNSVKRLPQKTTKTKTDNKVPKLKTKNTSRLKTQTNSKKNKISNRNSNIKSNKKSNKKLIKKSNKKRKNSRVKTKKKSSKQTTDDSNGENGSNGDNGSNGNGSNGNGSNGNNGSDDEDDLNGGNNSNGDNDGSEAEEPKDEEEVEEKVVTTVEPKRKTTTTTTESPRDEPEEEEDDIAEVETEEPTEAPTEAPAEETTEETTEEPTEESTEETTEETTETPAEETTEGTTEGTTEEPEEAETEEPEEEDSSEDTDSNGDSDTTTSRPTTTTTTTTTTTPKPSTHAYPPPFYPPPFPPPPYGLPPPPYGPPLPYPPPPFPYPPHAGMPPYPPHPPRYQPLPTYDKVEQYHAPHPESGPHYPPPPYGPHPPAYGGPHPHPPPHPEPYPHKAGPHPLQYPHPPPYGPPHRPPVHPEPPYHPPKGAKPYPPYPSPVPYNNPQQYPHKPHNHPYPEHTSHPYPPKPSYPPHSAHPPHPSGYPPHPPNYQSKGVGHPYPPHYKAGPSHPSHYNEYQYHNSDKYVEHPVPKGQYGQDVNNGPKLYNKLVQNFMRLDAIRSRHLPDQYNQYKPQPPRPYPVGHPPADDYQTMPYSSPKSVKYSNANKRNSENVGPGDYIGDVPHSYIPHSNQYVPQQYNGQPVIDNYGQLRTLPNTKCEIHLSNGVILPPLKYLSGAPFPPLLDENYQPIINVYQGPAPRPVNSAPIQENSKQIDKPKDDWSDSDPTYTFLASEQQFQRVVPQGLAINAKSNANRESDDQTDRIPNNGREGTDGKVYNSYTFPCKGKADGFYADSNLNCEVYYKCKDFGVDKRFKCPAGMRFNQMIKSCDFGHQVMCGQN